MSYRLSDVVYETRSFWVLSVGAKGFEVYRKASTHSVIVARIGLGKHYGLPRAIAECDQRQAKDDAAFDLSCKGRT